MGKRTMAVRYARALAEVLSDDADLTRVQGELDVVYALLRDDEELRSAFMSSALSRANKNKLVELLAREGGFHPGFRRLLTLLADQHHLSLLPEIHTSFATICDQRRRIIAAEVITAVAIDEQQQQQYCRSLESMTGKQVRLQTRVDPAILGGVVTRIGSEVYDGSVRGRLQKLQAQLKGE